MDGYQHEYWLDADPARLPCALVKGLDQKPLTVCVQVDHEDVIAQIWRVDIGRVALYLLDTDLASNSDVGRWITSRLYESNRAIRLAQYAVLGVGGGRALRAMAITPIVQSTSNRLRRGEPFDYAGAATHGLDSERLRIGFARRLATCKRLHLIAMMPERALALIGGPRPVQFVFAGKAHPANSDAKQVVSHLFAFKRAPDVAGRAAFLEDYGIMLAGQLVAGCDVWVNLPRPPNEPSGTSAMKSCLGGGLQLSVLDGWWVAMIRRSLMTNGPRFSAVRMLREYTQGIYRRN